MLEFLLVTVKNSLDCCIANYFGELGEFLDANNK